MGTGVIKLSNTNDLHDINYCKVSLKWITSHSSWLGSWFWLKQDRSDLLLKVTVIFKEDQTGKCCQGLFFSHTAFLFPYLQSSAASALEGSFRAPNPTTCQLMPLCILWFSGQQYVFVALGLSKGTLWQAYSVSNQETLMAVLYKYTPSTWDQRLMPTSTRWRKRYLLLSCQLTPCPSYFAECDGMVPCHALLNARTPSRLWEHCPSIDTFISFSI